MTLCEVRFSHFVYIGIVILPYIFIKVKEKSENTWDRDKRKNRRSRNQEEGEKDNASEYSDDDLDYDRDLFCSEYEVWPSEGLERGIMKRFEKGCQGLGWNAWLEIELWRERMHLAISK
eukprot:515262_1